MRSLTSRTVLVAGVAALALAAPFATSSASAHPSHHHSRAGADHAVFVQTNQVTGNTIVAYHRSDDGRLHRVGEYPTGGAGGVAVGAVADPLASQDSLVYDQANALLYAVNAGSNTVTVFGVRGDRLDRRQVIGSRGEFPVGVAVRGKLVYVLDAGGDGAVSGFRVAGGRLVPVPHSTRSLGLGGTDVPAFLDSPAQVGFSPDGRHVVVTTKTHNTIDVFGVRRDGRLTRHFVANPSASPVPFAFTWSARGDLVMTEAGGSNVTTYRIHRDNSVSVLDGPLSDGQKALCWIAGARGHFFGSNTGTKTISAYDVARNGSVSFAGAPDGIVATTDAVPVDLAVSEGGRYLYVQEPTTGVVQGYAVHRDGSLTLVTTESGLPTATPMEGIVAA